MKQDNPWRTLKRIFGQTRPKSTQRFDATFIAALEVLSSRESQRLGAKISQATIIQNLTTRDSNFFRSKRSELREVYEQLNKDQSSETRAKQHK